MANPPGKIKIFTTYQRDFSTLETDINQWLSDNADIQILQIMQTESSGDTGWDLVITVHYTDQTS